MERHWPQHWLRNAYLASSMSTCKSRPVGAVFVKNKRLIATGFNGVPSGYDHPTECERKKLGLSAGESLNLCICIHAEANGLFTAARHGQAVDGSVVYTTTQPCAQCAGALVNAGINAVIYDQPYPDSDSALIFKKANVKICQAVRNHATKQYLLTGDRSATKTLADLKTLTAPTGDICLVEESMQRFVSVSFDITPTWVPLDLIVT